MASKSLENLDNAVSLLITKAVSGADTAVSFLTAEIPEVIKQVLIWEALWNLLLGIIVLSIAVLFAIATVKAVKKEIELGRSGDGGYFFLAVLTGGAGSATFFISVVYLKIPLMIWLAPKVFLIRYAADLVK